MSTPEMETWDIGELRREIFSYLRKDAFRRCMQCRKVLMWNPGEVKCRFIRTYNGYVCIACMADEVDMYSCTVS